MLKSIEAAALLGPDDPSPVMTGRPGGASPLLLACDHAGNCVPRRLGAMGLAEDDLEDHIGIDIGIYATSSWMAHHLDAPLIGQAYSRLVVDCNRRPGTPTSMAEVSDGRRVPGNEDLSATDRQARITEIFEPYHAALAGLISERRAFLGHPPILCAMHSFTRVYGGVTRDWDIGVIHGPDAGIADRLLAALAGAEGLRVGRNVPYTIDFAGDYTIPHHAEATGLPYVEIEICQDRISTCRQQRRMAALLADAFRQSVVPAYSDER